MHFFWMKAVLRLFYLKAFSDLMHILPESKSCSPQEKFSLGKWAPKKRKLTASKNKHFLEPFPSTDTVIYV